MSQLTTIITALYFRDAAMLVRHTRLATRLRAATFIEYVILAGIAVVVGILVITFLPGWISGMLNHLNNQQLQNPNQPVVGQ
jgi:Flp pilus assembly pilin Flp